MDNRAYDRLRSEVNDAGLLKRTPAHGAIEMVLVLLIYAAAAGLIEAGAFFVLPTLLAVVGMIQATYLTHELGHGHYFRRRASRGWSYLFANVLTGLSRSWWAQRHNRIHHGHTNVIDMDGDINAGGGVFLGRQGYPGWFHRYQHFLFWLLLPFLFPAFMAASLRFVVTRRLWGELALISAHLALPAALFATYGVFAVVLLYACYSVWFSLALIVNHLAMPVVSQREQREACRLAITAKTTRNVRGGTVIRWLFGGGNAHIEHHLFPAASKHHMVAIKRITRRHFDGLELPYHEYGAGRIYADIFAYLRRSRAGRAGEECRDAASPRIGA